MDVDAIPTTAAEPAPPLPSTEPLSLEAALGLLDQATDPLWLAQAALFISSSPSAQLGNVAVALARAWEATTGFEEAARAAVAASSEGEAAAISPERREALAARREIGERRRRLRTWIELLGGEAALKRAEDDERKAALAAAGGGAGSELDELADLVDDDPWAELEESSDDDEAPSAGGRAVSRTGTHRSTASTSCGGGTPRSALPFDLPTFLAAPLPYLALHLTTPPQLRSLAVFVGRHRDALAPFRFTLLESIPDWVQPELFRALLPGCDDEMELELPWAADLVKGGDDDDDAGDEMAWLGSAEAHRLLGMTPIEPLPDLPTEPELLSATDLTAWYRHRIESIEATSGLVDRALAFLQHAVSRNVPDLDSLGEDLSLLSKLVYDARSQASSSAAVVAAADVSEWTLARWRAATPEEVTAGYLRYATSTTVVPIIRSLLLPYLFVLLSRSERTDMPDPTIPARLIQAWLLTAPLDLAVEVFAASKATLPEHERILKRDEEVAREALAILYGSQRTDRWDVMSRIFECMPAWTFGPEDHEDGEGSMTLLALSQFLRPTAAAPAPSPTDLHTFFLPLRAPALSILLDTLDLHLDAAETFARWGVPAPLGWFILSAEDRAEQLSWATRLARRGGERAEANEAAKARRVGKGKAPEGWEALLRDMKKLRGDGDGALGRLSEVEVVKVFFGGLFSSGNFVVAKTMLNARPAPLDRSSIEELVLAASREFYDNAETGNLHSGEMKQAYGCLSVLTPPTPAVEKEQAFIEATSRIASYNLSSRSASSSTLSPLEVRLSKDRLSIVSRILSTSDDAYKHPEVILELVDKLGYRGDKAAECKTLGMLADAAVQEGDWERGVGYVERMVTAVQAFGRKKRARYNLQQPTAAATPRSDSEVDAEQEAVDVCWKTCYQFGRQSAFADVDRKLSLMGHALDFCPADTISDLLVAWRKLEEEVLCLPRETGAGDRPRSSTTNGGTAPSAAARAIDNLPALAVSAATQLTGLGASELDHMRRRDIAAAAASRTINTLSSSLSSFRPLGGGSSVRSASPASSVRSQTATSASADHSVASLFGGLGGKEDDQDVVKQGRRALTKGVGWLLGASEEEMGGDLL